MGKTSFILDILDNVNALIKRKTISSLEGTIHSKQDVVALKEKGYMWNE